MSLASNLVATPASGEGSAITFDEIVRDSSGTVRSDTSRPLNTPRTLTIKHTMASLNAKGPKVDRHLVSIADTTLTDSIPSTATVNLSLVVPRDYTGDVGALADLAEGVLGVNISAILRGES